MTRQEAIIADSIRIVINSALNTGLLPKKEIVKVLREEADKLEGEENNEA